MRQRKAPWEGYLLQRSTILFIAFYIIAMLVIQLVVFFSELSGKTLLPYIGIANTAHIVGAVSGILLGRCKFFSWQPQQK